MGMYRMMCRSVPCCRRHSSLLWTFLVIALVIYIVYSHVHPRNQLTQLIVDKLPAAEKGGFWGKEDERDQQGGDRIHHGPFPGERWPHGNNNGRLADDAINPITPVIPHEAQIDRKYLLDNQWDSNERQNQWRNRGNRQGYATGGDQMRRGFDDRFNRFGEGFRRGDDSRFKDNRNNFIRRGGWNDHRARTSYPQDSHRLKDQGRWGIQDSRGEDHARRGWVDRNRPRFPDEDQGDGNDHHDSQNKEEQDHGRERNEHEDEDEDENHQGIKGHDNVQIEDNDLDENRNLDKDRDENNDLDKDQDEDNDLDKDQDVDNNLDKGQDEDNNIDQGQDEDHNLDKDQDEDNNIDQGQDVDNNLDKGQDEDNNIDQGQDEDHNLDKDQDENQDLDHDKGHEEEEEDQDQDQNHNRDQNQDENQDQEQEKDLNLEHLQHKPHADRVAAVQKALIKAGKVPLLGKPHASLQDQDKDLDLDHLQHKEHADRVAAVQNALLRAGQNPLIGKSHDSDQVKKQDGSRNLDHDMDDEEAREDMRARIMKNPVLRGPPDLRDDDLKPAQIAPPVGAIKEQEELPELDLNEDEVKRRRKQFERRGGPESIQQGPGIVDAPPPSRLTLQSWDLRKLEETFHKYVLTKQINCQLIVRAGKKQHGGWNLCLTLETRPMVPCLIYSFGFDTDYSFEDDVAKKYGCETHYFDPKLGSYLSEIRRSTGVTMHKYGLSDKNGYVPTHKWFVKTLATIKKQLRHTQPIDILKIDIEDNEWRSLPEMLNSGVMGQVRQLLVEVHILAKGRHTPTAEDYINYLQIMRNLYIDGFRIAAVRQDDTELPSMDGLTRAQNYELLFLRIDRY